MLEQKMDDRTNDRMIDRMIDRGTYRTIEWYRATEWQIEQKIEWYVEQ